MSRKVHVVINPASGQDEPVLAVLNREFDRLGVDWSCSVTKKDGDAAVQTTEAVSRGVDCVAAYGGDGTVSAVAGALVRTAVPLVILPGGTGNVVGTELGLPATLDAAARAVGDEAEETSIDVLEMGERVVLLRLGFGADARMIRHASREQKDRLGWLAYLYGALTEVREPRTARYRLTIDGEARELEALTVLVANIGRIGRGGLTFATEIDPADGRLDVLALRSADLESFLAVGASVLGLRSTRDAEPGGPAPLLHLTGREVRIEADPAQEVQVDGDPAGRTPVTVRVAAGALKVLLPPPAPR